MILSVRTFSYHSHVLSSQALEIKYISASDSSACFGRMPWEPSSLLRKNHKALMTIFTGNCTFAQGVCKSIYIVGCENNSQSPLWMGPTCKELHVMDNILVWCYKLVWQWKLKCVRLPWNQDLPASHFYKGILGAVWVRPITVNHKGKCLGIVATAIESIL